MNVLTTTWARLLEGWGAALTSEARPAERSFLGLSPPKTKHRDTVKQLSDGETGQYVAVVDILFNLLQVHHGPPCDP
jgi:hypothetical protein